MYPVKETQQWQLPYTTLHFSFIQPSLLSIYWGQLNLKILLPPAVPEYSYDPVLKLVESSGWQPWHSLGKGGTSLPGDGPGNTDKRELQEL